MQASRVGIVVVIAFGMVLAGSAGCVRRTLRITTEPPGAIVHLNDQEIGRTPTEVDFTWYGDYDVLIRKEGYETLKTHWQVDAPWYQWIPFDFFAEVLWPGHIHDVHEREFTLTAAVEPGPEELTERAASFRDRAIDIRP